MAAYAPTEILQVILSHCTPETFHHARQVCRSWRRAAFSAVVLRRQLQSMPVPLAKNVLRELEVSQLNEVFDRTARANLFGMRHRVEKVIPDRQQRLLVDRVGNINNATTVSVDGTKVAAISGAELLLYELESDGLRLLSSRRINAFWKKVNNSRSDGITSWMSMGLPFAKCQLAVSRRNLVAIGLDRTIQLHDMSEHSQEPYLADYVLNSERKERSMKYFGWSEVRGVIESLEFVEEDRLLRITMGKEGDVAPLTRVIYLGRPTTEDCMTELADYWRNNVSNVYLDSVELAQMFGGDYKISFRGLQLLPRRADGERPFVTATHSSMRKHYCYGLISAENEVSICGQMPDRAERGAGTWMGQLGNTSPDKPIKGAATALFCQPMSPRWDYVNIPEAHVLHPILAASKDDKLWAVYEQGGGLSATSEGAIYVCRLPDATVSSTTRHTADASASKGWQSLEIKEWPIRLDTVKDHVHSLRFEEVLNKPENMNRSCQQACQYKLIAETDQCSYEWDIL